MATFSEAIEHPLKKYELPGATIGKEIAGGAYGVVYELIWNGMRFAGKKIRDYLKPSVYTKKLTEECEKLMKMRHPCIVQFIGVHRPVGSDSLTIVMEYLTTTLSAAIQQYKSLPEEISFSILENVADNSFSTITWFDYSQIFWSSCENLSCSPIETLTLFFFFEFGSH